MKTCKKCGLDKPFTEFYMRKVYKDGFVPFCKPCFVVGTSARQQVTKPWRTRTSRPPTPASDITRAHKRTWNACNSEKKAAHKKVQNAIDRGTLSRLPCERCGRADTQAHHDDYSRPLEVLWLCPTHHGIRHRELNDAI